MRFSTWFLLLVPSLFGCERGVALETCLSTVNTIAAVDGEQRVVVKLASAYADDWSLRDVDVLESAPNGPDPDDFGNGTWICSIRAEDPEHCCVSFPGKARYKYVLRCRVEIQRSPYLIYRWPNADEGLLGDHAMLRLEADQ